MHHPDLPLRLPRAVPQCRGQQLHGPRSLRTRQERGVRSTRRRSSGHLQRQEEDQEGRARIRQTEEGHQRGGVRQHGRCRHREGHPRRLQRRPHLRHQGGRQ